MYILSGILSISLVAFALVDLAPWGLGQAVHEHYWRQLALHPPDKEEEEGEATRPGGDSSSRVASNRSELTDLDETDGAGTTDEDAAVAAAVELPRVVIATDGRFLYLFCLLNPGIPRGRG